MDQYPTEEEEFELQYQEEMDMMDDYPDVNEVNIEPTPAPSKRFNSTQHSQKTQKSILQSPSISQIFPSSPASSIEDEGGPVNRRLFGTPGTSSGPKRFASTPFYGKSSKINRIEEVLEDVEEIEEIPENGALDELMRIGTNKNKRKLDELFGDSPKKTYDRDLVYGDDTYVDREAKKAKQEEERDLDLIEKIMEARKKTKEGKNPGMQDHVDKLNALHDFKMRNLSYTIPNYPFLPIVRSDDERLYVRFHSEEYEKKHIDDIRISEKGFSGLLGDQKEQIWTTAREITVKRMTAMENSSSDDVVEIPSAGLASSKGDLWVDRYKPKKYYDLLSDEATNRTLLYWLKMWDKVVFGKDFKKPQTAYQKQQQNLNTFNKKTGRFESTGGWKNRKSRLNLNTETDEHGRPIQKVALLSGPPGLGKTTLAHTIARHAGYQIRELNASDDRNPDSFKMALENGTQMTSVLDSEKRPNCIILDEIDGAPHQSIDFLLRFISDTAVTKPSKKGAKEQASILKRPIICICNDLYTPALRQLRQIAFVVNFPPIESPKLGERLLEIASKEGLQTDLMALMALAEKSGNDVRSCISMMQFFNATKNKLLLTDVLNGNFGTKDRNQGLFDVWGAIFQIKRPQKRLETNNNEEAQVVLGNMSTATRMNNVLAVVHAGGDYDRLMQGVYENFLRQKMPDPNLTGVVEACHWFCFSDILNQQINHLQNYSLYPYLQFPFVVWHLLFASLAWPKINFPHQGFEFNQKTTTTKMVFQAFRKGISSGVIGAGQGAGLLTETVPFLKRILSPSLRSVSVQLLTPREKYDLNHTVEIMADFGLIYNQLKKPDGMYEYTLEPDINLMCKFDGYPGINLAYFSKQLISKEIESVVLRRMAPKASGPLRPLTNNNSKKTAPANHLQTLKPRINEKSKGKELEKRVSKDFFGRRIAGTSSTSHSEGSSNTGWAKNPTVGGIIGKSPIWYRYKEGFNNAVRKDVFMKDLL